MRKTLKTPFHVSVFGDWAATFPLEDYTIFYDFGSKFGKCMIGVYFSDSKMYDEIGRRLANTSYDNWIIYNENGEMKVSEEFQGSFLLDEFDVGVLSRKTYNRVRDRLLKLNPVPAGMRPEFLVV